jgi:hypothetical protein
MISLARGKLYCQLGGHKSGILSTIEGLKEIQSLMTYSVQAYGPERDDA